VLRVDEAGDGVNYINIVVQERIVDVLRETIPWDPVDEFEGPGESHQVWKQGAPLVVALGASGLQEDCFGRILHNLIPLALELFYINWKDINAVG